MNNENGWHCNKCGSKAQRKTSGEVGQTCRWNCKKCGASETHTFKPSPIKKLKRAVKKSAAKLDNVALSRKLSEAAIKRGVQVKQRKWGRAENRKVQNNLIWLTGKFQHVGTQGLMEIGE